MKNVFMLFALFSALSLQAQVRGADAYPAAQRGFAIKDVTPAPDNDGREVTTAAPFVLPSFALTNDRYYWVHNGDKTGQWGAMYLASDGRNIKVQTPYSQQVYNSYTTVFNDDGEEGTSTTVRCKNETSALVIEFDNADGAILYIRFLEGANGSKTHCEWFPALYDLVAQLKN